MKQSILFVLFLVGGFMGFSQNPLVKQWDKRFGGTNNDYLYSFQQTTDGGYIIGGPSNSRINGDKTQDNWDLVGGILGLTTDYWVVKTDSLGNKQWDKRFGGTDSEGRYSFSLQQTTDGGYILGGSSNSGSNGDKTQTSWGSSDYWIVKIDSIGNKQWDKRFGGVGYEIFSALQQTYDGGYIFGGYSISDSSGDKTQDSKGSLDYWIVKSDSLGNKQWDKSFGGVGEDYFCSLQQTTDRGYILGGYSNSGVSGDKTQNNYDTSFQTYDYWIVKIDSFGNKNWDKSFGGINDDRLYSLKQTNDGGYILGGCSNSEVIGDKTQLNWGAIGYLDYWIVKIDLLGSKEWDKNVGGVNHEDALWNISQTFDGGYLLAGNSYSDSSGDKSENNLGKEQTWVVKTDRFGNKQWDKTLKTNVGNTDDEVGFAIQTLEGCYVMANYTVGGIGGDKTQPSQGFNDYWIIKFCDTTTITNVSPLSLSEEPQIKIYPNPATSQLFIETNGEEIKQVNIYNTMGEVVMAVGSLMVNRPLSIVNLPSGVYIAEIKTKDASVKKRWVKE